MEPQGASPIPDPERDHRAQGKTVPAEPAGTSPDPYAKAAPAWLRYGFFLAGLSLMGWLAVTDTSTFFRRPAAAPPPAEAALADPFPGEIRATAELVSPLERPPGSSLGMLKTTPEEQGIDFSESELPVAPDPAQPPLAPEGAFGAYSRAPDGGNPPPAAAPTRGRHEMASPMTPVTAPVPARPRLRPIRSVASARSEGWQSHQPFGEEEKEGQARPSVAGGVADPQQAQRALMEKILAGMAGATRGQNSITIKLSGEARYNYRCPKGYWLNSIAHTCCPGKECCEKRDPRGACTLQGGGPPAR